MTGVLTHFLNYKVNSLLLVRICACSACPSNKWQVTCLSKTDGELNLVARGLESQPALAFGKVGDGGAGL